MVVADEAVSVEDEAIKVAAVVEEGTEEDAVVVVVAVEEGAAEDAVVLVVAKEGEDVVVVAKVGCEALPFFGIRFRCSRYDAVQVTSICRASCNAL